MTLATCSGERSSPAAIVTAAAVAADGWPAVKATVNGPVVRARRGFAAGWRAGVGADFDAALAGKAISFGRCRGQKFRDADGRDISLERIFEHEPKRRLASGDSAPYLKEIQ